MLWCCNQTDQTDNTTTCVLVYENLNLSQAATLIVHHLEEKLRNFKLKGSTREAADTLRVFKRKRVSPIEDSIVWEHFQDMIPETDASLDSRNFYKLTS